MNCLGEEEFATVAKIIKNIEMKEILVPDLPAQVKDLNNKGQTPQVVIDDVTRTFIWQGTFKLVTI